MNSKMKPAIQIMVAEDDPVSRRMLEAFLTKRDFEVITASNGTDALAILEKENPPRLALLDWMMPGLEGVQVCRQIRERNAQAYTYIILLTAKTQKKDLLQGLESGADDYLTKPFDPQELHARVRVGQRILDLEDRLIAAQEELRFSASYDALTGVANRGAIMETLRREHARQERNGGFFGVIMLDLDHFKRVNDTHGHFCGDAVLREAAKRMTSSVRAYDTVGRYGGEEFLVVVPAAAGPSMLALAERIRKKIEREPIKSQAGMIKVTASLGVAVSNAADKLPLETLLQLADEALYRAKGRGRNCSELASPREQGSTAAVSEVATPAKVGLG